MNLNSVIIAGYSTRDIELKTFDDFVIGEFTLANNYSVKVNGEWVSKASFIPVKIFAKGASKINWVEKGSPVIVSGKLIEERWEGKNGEQRARIIIQADRLERFNVPDENKKKKAPDEEHEPKGLKSPVKDDSFIDDIPF
jgi:single-strand DNA-binding protein